MPSCKYCGKKGFFLAISNNGLAIYAILLW